MKQLIKKTTLKLNRKKAILSAMAIAVMSVPALAADATPTPVDMSPVVDGFVTAYTSAAGQAVSAVGQILPALASIIILMFLLWVIPRAYRAIRKA